MRNLVSLLTFVACTALAGASNVGSFDNDDALDWVDGLERAGSSVLATTLREVDAKAEYVEAPQCSVALAAAEVVAAAHGHPAAQLPAPVTAWLKRVAPSATPELLAQARAAVKTCRDSDRSELRQLWLESDESTAWLADTAGLLSRLN
jgi:hypothetical protein